ncbi:titin homolog isoform X2 [Haliotis cracherodii]|uniref:titin homolog isoform X2 n=1 Tax=Haliotis cracherodii TaxID=6455 RepID=UPI0039ED9687
MSVLSSLAKGYGSWNGDIDLTLTKETTNILPQTAGSTRPHRHGITVSPRAPNSVPATAPGNCGIRFQNCDGKLDLPKTFLTRKGALLLFTAPDDSEQTNVPSQRFHRRQKGKQLIDLSLKLGTLDRLCKSVLQYGGEEYDRENSSVSDPRNKTFLKFVHQPQEPEDVEIDAHSQPGGDLDFYLRDLKSRSSSRQHVQGDSGSVSRSPELREILRDLDGAFPRSMGGRSMTSADFTESKSGTPRQRVLSSKKLTASLRSSTYLGRPASAVSASSSVTSEPAVNLPRITSESSIRSRSSTKSGLWVQGEESNQGSGKGESSRSSSAKSRSTRSRSARSRSSRQMTPVNDNVSGTKEHVLPLQAEEEEEIGDATSAADEQEILLLSDAEVEAEEGGSGGGTDQWPLMEEGSRKGSGCPSAEVQAVTQPLMPQYRVTKLGGDADDMVIDTAGLEEEEEVEDVPGGPLADAAQGVIPQHDVQTQGETTQDVPAEEPKMEMEETMEVEELEDEGVPFTDMRDSEGISESQTPSIIDAVSEANKDIGDQSLSQPDDSANRDLKTDQELVENGDLATVPDLIADGAGSGGDRGGGSDEDGDRDGIPGSPVTTQASDEDVEGPTDAAQGEVEEGGGSLFEKDEEASAGGAGAGPERKDSPPGQMLEGEGRQAPASPVREKSKVTFNEKVTTQIVPETPPETKRQPQPPKTKPSTKPTSKTRTPAKGGNNKDVKMETKKFVKVMDITSVQPETDKQEVEKEVPAAPAKKVRVKKPPARHVETKSDKTKSSVLPAHMEEFLGRRSTLKSQEELEDEIAQMSVAIEDTLAGPTLAVDAGEGLTAEELTLAQEALLARVKEAESKIDNVTNKTLDKPKVAVKATEPKSKKKNKKDTVEEKRDLQKERAAIKERRAMEKQQRLQEAMALQEKIRAREAERKTKEEEARKKAEDLAEEMEDLRKEEEEIQQAEDDARLQVAMARKIEREARDRRRKEDLERKKQEAIRRREKEKDMIEAARLKEAEMLQRIADNEMKRRLEEEERFKREEEERAAQEKYEEEMRQAQREAEEEELRMRELEKEAEEEAMQRLVEERENAVRRRWKLKQLARQIEEEERKKREAMLLEEYRLEEEKKARELEEEMNREEEKKRLEELQRMEAEARETMRHELERRREWAQKRREVNLERRGNLDNVRHGQGITRAWVFSYFMEWPRESYNKLMGEDHQYSKMQAFSHKPKPAEEKPPAEKPAEVQPPEEIPLELEEIVDPPPS